MENKLFRLNYKKVGNLKVWNFDFNKTDYIYHWGGINRQIFRCIYNYSVYGIFLYIEDHEK